MPILTFTVNLNLKNAVTISLMSNKTKIITNNIVM